MTSHLTLSEYNKLYELIVTQCQELEQFITRQQELDSSDTTIGELSLYDNHPADVGTELHQATKEYAFTLQAKTKLASMKGALQNIMLGQYGKCHVCAQPIPFERLEALPDATTCIQHSPPSSAVPTISTLYNEAGKIARGLSRQAQDESRAHYSRQDQEEAWKLVESWGNSSQSSASRDELDPLYDTEDDNWEELEGFVTDYESFLANDLYGNHVMVFKNKAFEQYVAEHEPEQFEIEHEQGTALEYSDDEPAVSEDDNAFF